MQVYDPGNDNLFAYFSTQAVRLPFEGIYSLD